MKTFSWQFLQKNRPFAAITYSNRIAAISFDVTASAAIFPAVMAQQRYSICRNSISRNFCQQLQIST